MISIQTFDEYPYDTPSAVTVGKFDGLHSGHELLMEHLAARKKESGEKIAAVTFSDPPKKKVSGQEQPLLVTNEEKEDLFRRSGVDVLLTAQFSDEFMRLSPEEFVRLLVNKLHMSYLCAGTDFRFGYKGQGTVSLLRDLAVMHHFTLDVIEKKQRGNRDISSTYVREEIAAGHIRSANSLLGYPYFLSGRIVHGNHIGKTIGHPTINIHPDESKLLPKNGVYRTRVHLGGKDYDGLTNIGIRPTIKEDKKKVSVETHILDFDEDVYNERAMITFLDFLRPEMKFSTVEALRGQITEDVRALGRILGTE